MAKVPREGENSNEPQEPEEPQAGVEPQEPKEGVEPQAGEEPEKPQEGMEPQAGVKPQEPKKCMEPQTGGEPQKGVKPQAGEGPEESQEPKAGEEPQEGDGHEGKDVLKTSLKRESDWSDVPSEVVVEPFDQQVGPTFSTSSDPTEMFLAFLTPELIDHIVLETNQYACRCLRSSHTGHGPVLQWETDRDEMKAYFGFSILMGMNKLPDLYDYWSSDEALHYIPVA